ncbi:lysophospholipid acyltransferase family protein [Desulfuromonas thiophila]|jgi:lauroyl/myristoyl acyltransferase|uniref:lysophospholipid acyltransferase family protein n=1 Tax=Desulfuromonas thiophila TaxID=57664 RepID=UPI0024A8AEA5|nr:hypothetical protein [Desulfuromonas thiophila]MCK9172754.1 hypothetical protein [Desulfuromonas thiophila]
MSVRPALKRLRYRCLFPLLAVLPSNVGYRLASLVGYCDAWLHPLRHPICHAMAQMLPDLATNDALLRRQARRYWRMLACDTLDGFRMPGFNRCNTRNQIELQGIEALARAQADKRGVILVISHFGRFFMLAPGLGLAGYPFAMLTTVVDERHPSYDATDRWHIATKLRHALDFSAGDWITTGDDPRRIYRCLRDGQTVLIALDGNETNNPQRIEFPFLGGTLSLPESIVRIARATGARLVYAATRDQSRGAGVRIELYDLPDDPQQALAAAVQQLESDLRQTPWQWWLWPAAAALWRPGQPSSSAE